MNRHYSTHINELFTGSKPTHLESCLLLKRPIVSIEDPKKNTMVAYCLHCNKGSYHGVYNHTPGKFIQYHCKEGCNMYFKEYKELFEEQLKLKLLEKPEEEEDTANVIIEKLKKQLEDARKELIVVKEELKDTKKELDESYDINNSITDTKCKMKQWFNEVNEEVEEYISLQNKTTKDDHKLINNICKKLEDFP